MYSYRDHSLFLTSRSRYGFLFDLKPYDYKKWARGLSKAGYATDRRYPQKLINIIEQYELYRYDSPGANNNDLALSLNAAREDRTHTVKYGDTLYSISRRYDLSLKELKRINNMQDDKLAVGQKLIIETE